jgi:hypothetical protein
MKATRRSFLRGLGALVLAPQVAPAASFTPSSIEAVLKHNGWAPLVFATRDIFASEIRWSDLPTNNLFRKDRYE